jgi:primase-polymerase (primpol)-like protein
MAYAVARNCKTGKKMSANLRSTGKDGPMRQKQYRPLDIDKVRANIPADMLAVRQWCVWKLELDGNGKHTKIPCNAQTGGAGSSTNRKTWTTFDATIQAYESGDYDGIGFYLGNGFAGVDLDACRDSKTGEIAPWALGIIRDFETYTEISPSGTGLHLFGKGKVPGKDEKGLNRNVGGRKIEIYSKGRFFTFTGNVLAGSPGDVQERQDSITTLYNWMLETCAAQDKAKQCIRLDDRRESADMPLLPDDKIISLLLQAANAAKFKRLWSGDCATDYPLEGRPEGDHSAADLGFCAMVAFYTPDPAQIDRIFRKGNLYREKWERPDYRDATIAKAISGTKQHFGSKPNATKPSIYLSDSTRVVCFEGLEQANRSRQTHSLEVELGHRRHQHF